LLGQQQAVLVELEHDVRPIDDLPCHVADRNAPSGRPVKAAFMGVAVQSDVDHRVTVVRLDQPVLGGSLDLKSPVREHGNGGLDISFPDEEVDVVLRLGPTAARLPELSWPVWVSLPRISGTSSTALAQHSVTKECSEMSAISSVSEVEDISAEASATSA